MTTWDSTVDVVIVGSGGGGMVAALTAADAGASALVLEKQDDRRLDRHVRRHRLGPEQPGHAGGRSGGLLRGRHGPLRGRRGRRRAGLLVRTSARLPDRRARDGRLPAGLGVRLVYCRGYSDYYSSAKGGHDVGRGIEPVPFDGRVLGAWLEKLQPGLAQSLGLAVMTNEARSLSNYNRSLRAFAVSARVVIRTYGGPAAPAGAAHQRRVADRADAEGGPGPGGLGVDRGAARGPDRRGRPGGRRPHHARREAGADPGPSGRLAGRRRLRPQSRDARASTAAISRTGPVVHRQSGRHRRGTPDRHAARRARPT